MPVRVVGSFFFFNDTATTEIYTLSLHDALPICPILERILADTHSIWHDGLTPRSEEHTSALQSHSDLVCRLLLEKKKHHANIHPNAHATQKTTPHLFLSASS